MSVLKYLSLFLISSLLLVGCSKKSNNPIDPINDGNDGNPVKGEAELIINGGGFNSITVSFQQGVSYYIPSEDVTYAEFWGATNADTIVVSVVFPGSKEGTFDWDTDTQSAFLISGTNTGGKVFVSTNYGETYISSYGNINQTIVGKIYGILKNSVNENDDITIDGNFNLKRLPDVSE